MSHPESKSTCLPTSKLKHTQRENPTNTLQMMNTSEVSSNGLFSQTSRPGLSEAVTAG